MGSRFGVEGVVFRELLSARTYAVHWVQMRPLHAMPEISTTRNAERVSGDLQPHFTQSLGYGSQLSNGMLRIPPASSPVPEQLIYGRLSKLWSLFGSLV